MTKAEIEAVLQAAFRQCEANNSPLSDRQKQILLQVAEELADDAMVSANGGLGAIAVQPEGLDSQQDGKATNPLDELTPEQRQALLQFLKEHQRDQDGWKVKLLNDWLHNRNSGSVQFIHELYGPQWLNRVRPVHLAKYYEPEAIKLKVGDRIEVTNGLWEWVQEDGPCSREWLLCTVVSIREVDGRVSEGSEGSPAERSHISCTVRFESGAEYELQGVYEWNRYNWRWPQV